MPPLTKRIFIVAVCVLTVIAGGFLIEVLLSQQAGWPFGHTQPGHVAGWIGFAVTLAVFGYSVKKRYGRKKGWPKGWFRVHQVAGVAGPLLILIHSGPHFHALVPLFAMLAMGMVVVSGVVGVAIHRKALSLMKTRRTELLSQGLSPEDVDNRLYDFASAEETFRIWQIIHAPMAVIFLALVIIHVVGALYFGGW